MDMADMADKFIEDQILTSVMQIRQHDSSRKFTKVIQNKLCDTCGSDIPKARLKLVPGCTHCIQCASKQERECAGLFSVGDRRRINSELDDYLLSVC